jgi:hypothetical protein
MELLMELLIGLVSAAVALIVFTFIFMWIWNAVMPDVFGVKSLTPWQALGILILAFILFGGHRAVHVYGYGYGYANAPPHTQSATP